MKNRNSQRHTTSLEKEDLNLSKINFVLFHPEWVPHNSKITQELYRKEDPKRESYPRSSYKIMLEDGQGRVWSIKQFLYDWTPPAYDCPSLWLKPEFEKLDIQEPLPFLIEGDVLWIGRNYRNKQAATLNKLRTSIEITIQKGNFTKEEFIKIGENLIPVDLKAQAHLLDRELSELAYQTRHENTQRIIVPISFWKYKHDSKGREEFYAYNLLSKDKQEKYLIDISEEYDYSPKTVILYKGTEGNLQSYELIYESNKVHASYIRILVTQRGSRFALDYPPQIDSQKCRFEKIVLNGQNVYYAYRSDKLGPHEAVWKTSSNNNLILVKPSTWTNREWFLELIKSLLI